MDAVRYLSPPGEIRHQKATLSSSVMAEPKSRRKSFTAFRRLGAKSFTAQMNWITISQTRSVWDCQSGLPINWGGLKGQLIGSPMAVPDRSCLGNEDQCWMYGSSEDIQRRDHVVFLSFPQMAQADITSYSDLYKWISIE